MISMTNIHYHSINKLILFGGSELLFDVLRRYSKEFEIIVVTSPRHFEEVLGGTSLAELTKDYKLKAFVTEDVNQETSFLSLIDGTTLGLAFGAAWMFETSFVSHFAEGHLLDFMGIDLPRYRGGAHHSWQIMNQNNSGALHIQMILGGNATFHRGPIISSAYFDIPSSATTPDDFLALYSQKSTPFIRQFFDDVKSGHVFVPKHLDEHDSSYFPFLSTVNQGWVNWHWHAKDVVLFVRAFDAPYPGAATYLNGEKVIVRGAKLAAFHDRPHPFASGLVVQNQDGVLTISSTGGAITFEAVFDDDGKDITKDISLGSRFYTPYHILDNSMMFHAEYGAKGLKIND